MTEKPTIKQLQDQFNMYAPRDRPLAWTPKFMTKKPRIKNPDIVKPKNKQTEHTLQAQLVSYMKTCCPDVIVSASLNGELSGMARNVSEGMFYGWIAKLKARGMLSGYADLVLHWKPVKSCFIEVKRPDGGSENAAQINIRERLEEMGFSCYVIRSIEELKEIIKKENIPCRDSSLQ